MTPWRVLDDELAAWRIVDRQPTLWWRDDDAHRGSPALQQLLGICASTGSPVTLAVIPALLEASLVDAIAADRLATVVQHGYAHRNHAPPGARNWELGAHRPLAETLGELVRGKGILEDRFADRFAPVLVPPWNRIEQTVVDRLAAVGFRGLSTFGPRAARDNGGLALCNTHVDLIAWKRDRAFIGVEKALARIADHLRLRREGGVDAVEPTGILTHHLDCTEPTWTFLRELILRTRARGAQWLGVGSAFERDFAEGATCGRSA